MYVVFEFVCVCDAWSGLNFVMCFRLNYLAYTFKKNTVIQQCLGGEVDEDMFKQIFSHFFPQGGM